MSDTPETDMEASLLDVSCDDSCCAIYLEKNNVPVLDVVDVEFARRLERERDELKKAVTASVQAVQFAIRAIDDILGEAGYEGLPESKQENLYKAIEMLRSI
jgi:hypothetical protein